MIESIGNPLIARLSTESTVASEEAAARDLSPAHHTHAEPGPPKATRGSQGSCKGCTYCQKQTGGLLSKHRALNNPSANEYAAAAL
jgi:hypothetical protein